MPQELNKTLARPKPHPQPARLQGPPLKSLGKSALGFNNSEYSVPLNIALQNALQQSSSKGVRGAGRVGAESSLYTDTIIPLLRMLDEDVDETERAKAFGSAQMLLGTNVLKDLILSRAMKGSKFQGAANAASDYGNPVVANQLAKYYTQPYEMLGNVSPAEIMYQVGKMTPPIFGPSLPTLMEEGARQNVARKPFVKNLKTQQDRIDDVLSEDELAYTLMKLQNPKTSQTVDAKYKWSPTNPSPSENKKADALNWLSNFVNAKAKVTAPIGKKQMDIISDPVAEVKKGIGALRPTGNIVKPPAITGRPPTPREMRMQQ